MTYEPNLYICREGNSMQFRFFQQPKDKSHWKLLQDIRKAEPNIDKDIKHSLELIEGEYNDVNALWDKFEGTITVLKGLVTYRPLFERSFYVAMQELYDDNVMLMELCSSMSALYEIDGSLHDVVSVTKIYKAVSDRFVHDHPGFLGAKVIFASYRKVSPQTFNNYVETFRKMKAAYPDFIIGFDLVGQEDLGHPLLNFADKLQEFGKETLFFFHAGETNWYGHATNENLYDAVLLNTKRIGHGFALLKHPKLMELVMQKKIAIELNLISNQVLELVKDMRNHPASYFFAKNFPVVVSNDDPNFWGSQGLSYDFYEAFVGIMSRDADLKALKQLAMNSITYSGLN
ncbi:adenosine deaminase 2-like [Nasonia vitripennis]|uniref:Adenosine deaminase n=1 Tax=Nasonia vitripennis TaxID=7425 RepID=A0A7M7HA06_NASVI|nr:adenosine deaminase 2-like [Nasonia vitripennis]